MAARSAPTVSAEAPWLIVVDMQHVFADPQSPWATPDFAGAHAVVSHLVGAFDDRVVLTRFVPPDVVTGAWVAYYEQWPFALDAAAAPSFDLVAGLDAPGRPVVSLPSFGKWGPELDAAVGGRRDVVLAGVSTDCCVLSTALVAADAGVHVRVVADGCRGLSDADHRRALDAMALYAPLVEVTTSAAVLSALRG